MLPDTVARLYVIVNNARMNMRLPYDTYVVYKWFKIPCCQTSIDLSTLLAWLHDSRSCRIKYWVWLLSHSTVKVDHLTYIIQIYVSHPDAFTYQQSLLQAIKYFITARPFWEWENIWFTKVQVKNNGHCRIRRSTL